MRFKFDPNSTYAGRLDRISKRPIENQQADAMLLRLEFLIFRVNDGRLSTRGQIACRDIMLWHGMEKDPGVTRMADALGIVDAYSASTWLAAGDRRFWIMIRFGNPSEIDQRQPFEEVRGFNPEAEGLQLEYASHQTDVRWATVHAAASQLDVSESTVRRLIDCNKEQFGESLVRYTAGGHRRINLALLRHVGRA
jgi:hypothetical protein